MKKLMIDIPDPLDRELRDRLNALNRRDEIIHMKEEGAFMRATLPLRALVTAVIKDTLANRDDSELILLVKGERVKMGRPVLNQLMIVERKIYTKDWLGKMRREADRKKGLDVGPDDPEEAPKKPLTPTRKRK